MQSSSWKDSYLSLKLMNLSVQRSVLLRGMNMPIFCLIWIVSITKLAFLKTFLDILIDFEMNLVAVGDLRWACCVSSVLVNAQILRLEMYF